jgi:hypothetical protein
MVDSDGSRGAIDVGDDMCPCRHRRSRNEAFDVIEESKNAARFDVVERDRIAMCMVLRAGAPRCCRDGGETLFAKVAIWDRDEYAPCVRKRETVTMFSACSIR